MIRAVVCDGSWVVKKRRMVSKCALVLMSAVVSSAHNLIQTIKCQSFFNYFFISILCLNIFKIVLNRQIYVHGLLSVTHAFRVLFMLIY